MSIQRKKIQSVDMLSSMAGRNNFNDQDNLSTLREVNQFLKEFGACVAVCVALTCPVWLPACSIVRG